MERTVVSFEPEDKEWLDEKAKREGVSMAELVRRGVRLLREKSERGDQPLDALLETTSGTWIEEDGLEYQNRIRDEW